MDETHTARGTPTIVARGSSLSSGLTKSHRGGHIVDAGPVTTREVGNRPSHRMDDKIAELQESHDRRGRIRNPNRPKRSRDHRGQHPSHRADAPVERKLTQQHGLLQPSGTHLAVRRQHSDGDL